MKTKLISCSAVFLLSFACLASASEDAERGISIYDQFPNCSERREMKPGEPAPCELPAPAPTRRAWSSQSATPQNSTTGVTQGGQQSQRIGGQGAVGGATGGNAGVSSGGGQSRMAR